jgi:serine/threonine protein kinase
MRFTFAPESKPLDGYTIKRAIHRGGFGEVYYALSDAGKEVALKLLHNNLEVELRGVSQCLNLKHPNLVTIFDMKQDSEKEHWIVMEFVGGKGLYEVMQEHPKGMPLKDVLFWLSGITAGLSFLHDRGIVHRDLKPANIFADADIVKIGDVGLSKYISESRRSAQTQSVGTVYYMAPEVARGRYGREVDVYSTGVILYEMITGRVPFEGETTAEILMKHLTAEPDLSVLPEHLRPVLAAALDKDPDRRISEIEELERRFRNAIQESGFSVEKPAPVFASQPAVQKRSTPAMTTTLISHEKAAAAPTSAAAPVGTRATAGTATSAEPLGPFQSAALFWKRNVPAPVKWPTYALLILVLLRAGGGLSTKEWIVLLIVYLVWRKTSAKAEARAKAKESAVPDNAGPSPVPASFAPNNIPRAVQPVAMAAPQVAPSSQAMAYAVRNYSPATMRQIPAAQRMVDITTSLSISLAAVILVTAAVHLATPLLPKVIDVAFFGVVTLLAAISLIIPAKLWEGKSGDAFIRRMFQGAIGMGVGAVAFTLQRFLMFGDVRLLHSEGDGIFNGGKLGQISIMDSQGLPTMAGYMLFFALLFVARRWWWQADSFRSARFRISSTLVSLFLGFILTALLPFPNNLGATWALAISAVVQLSAGWTPQEERWLAPAPGVNPAAPVLAQVQHPVVGRQITQEA